MSEGGGGGRISVRLDRNKSLNLDQIILGWVE